MFIKTTHHIKVTAMPYYLADHSDPGEDHYVFAYTIELENQGDTPVQLIKRHWQITDAHGMTQEVRGDGVVGEQPIIAPNQSYRYTSGTALSTPSGIMTGQYTMLSHNGTDFDIAIPVFSLDSLEQIKRPN